LPLVVVAAASTGAELFRMVNGMLFTSPMSSESKL
jgi:hypothetical protein